MISFADGYWGWLGNQMFQYAATRALGLRRGVESCFPRNEPDLFKMFPLKAAPKPSGGILNNIYHEQHFHFDPKVLDLPDGTTLAGYFQSERYFADFGKTIREEFSAPEFLLPVFPSLVSVHVRRGDYLRIAAHHPPLTTDYYREAMSLFPKHDFLVFGDDLNWARDNLSGKGVAFSFGRGALEDMALMSRCAHHIIANSSFSWWGAWMNLMPDKRVIAPKRWFGPAKADWDVKDLLPEGWQRL
jgi:hypothetical protein